MRGRALLLGAALAAVVATAGVAISDEQPKKEAPGQDAMMEAMKKAAAPNENHARLKQYEGAWETSASFWMEPGKPPQVSKGKGENRMVLGGRYLHMHYSGEFMGEPFEGTGLLGYDNTAKQYVQTWADNMSTMIMIEHGAWDSKENAIVMRSEFDCPGTNEKKKTRAVLHPVEGSKYVYEMYEMGPEGKEIRTGEIIYTKK